MVRSQGVSSGLLGVVGYPFSSALTAVGAITDGVSCLSGARNGRSARIRQYAVGGPTPTPCRAMLQCLATDPETVPRRLPPTLPWREIVSGARYVSHCAPDELRLSWPGQADMHLSKSRDAPVLLVCDCVLAVLGRGCSSVELLAVPSLCSLGENFADQTLTVHMRASTDADGKIQAASRELSLANPPRGGVIVLATAKLNKLEWGSFVPIVRGAFSPRCE